MFILKKGHQPGVYVPLRALFLVNESSIFRVISIIICQPYQILTIPMLLWQHFFDNSGII